MNKTYIPQNIQNQNVKWYLINAKNKNLGRLSTKIASILKGKNETTYTPYVNSQQYIIVINAKDIYIANNKKKQKRYIRHSSKPGSLRIETLEKLLQRIPSRVIEKSVKGMLPKNSLGRQLFRQLKVYPNNYHPHKAQKPHIISFD